MKEINAAYAELKRQWSEPCHRGDESGMSRITDHQHRFEYEKEACHPLDVRLYRTVGHVRRFGLRGQVGDGEGR